ncbi:MAG: hypothetical protein OHK0045_02340 [Raineya sp.]
MTNRPIYSIPQIPANLAGKIESFARQIDIIAKENLVAIYLYGSITHKVFDNPSTNIKLLAVLKSAKVEEIENISLAIIKAKKEFNIDTKIITKEEVKTSADVFPIEFTDMKVKKFLLIGEDVFKNVQISMEDLRRSCELELKKRLFELRSFFVLNLKHPKLLVEKLLEDLSGFLMQADTVLYLKAGHFASSTEDLLKEIYKDFHIQNATLKKIYEMYKDTSKVPTDLLEIIELYNDYLSVVMRVAQFADALQVYKD